MKNLAVIDLKLQIFKKLKNFSYLGCNILLGLIKVFCCHLLFLFLKAPLITNSVKK